MNAAENEVTEGLVDELDALWRFALKLTTNKDDAADLVQRTCLRALEQRHNYNSQGKLRSWLFSIEHRVWLNELRSRQVRRYQSLNTANGTVSDMSDIVANSNELQSPDDPEINLLLDQVYNVVEGLPEAQRMVILLVCVEGFSYRETSEILDVPIGTIMSRLARARVSIGQHVMNNKDSYTKLGKVESS